MPLEIGHGLKTTLDALEYVANFYINEKLIEFDQRRTVADQLYQANAGILGSAKADDILARLGMSVDPVEIALKCIDTELDDTQLSNLLEYYSSVTSPEPIKEQAINSSENAGDSNSEDDFLLTLTMYTCSVFMKKIKPLDCAANDPQKLLAKVVKFVLTRFARETRNSVEQFQQLSCNLDILGPAKYKVFLQKLKACPQKNKSTLQRTSELLMACGDDVVSEYLESSDDDQQDSVNLWESSADEEGLQVKITKNCCIDLSDLEFRDLAMSLFHIHVNPKCVVEKRRNSVCLKTEEYLITFSLCEESGSWLVFLADRRVTQNED